MMNNMHNFSMNPMMVNPNPMFMNNMGNFGINNQQNLNFMNVNPIQYYQNEIMKLKEIIRQKDYIIKQKDLQIADLNKKLNPEIIPIQGVPIIPNKHDKNSCVSLVIQANIRNIKCFKNQKASVIEEILNLKRINLTYNYKPISLNQTLEENGIYDGSIINLTNQVYNIDFSKDGNHCVIPLDGECPLKIAIISFCEKFGVKDLYSKALNDEIHFFCEKRLINILDNTPIKKIFKAGFNPRVLVL